MSGQPQREIQITSIETPWRHWAARMLENRWGSLRMVSRGVVHDLSQLPGFIAFDEGKPVGLVTYHISGADCEIVTLNSLLGGHGIGTALIDAVRLEAQQRGCSRLWLITTNDNLPALRFYQTRGFTMAALYPNALAESRRLKPEIPYVGLDGIPLRDEIELEMPLQQ